MRRTKTKQAIIYFIVSWGFTLSAIAQQQQVWKRFCDKTLRDYIIIDTLPSKLERSLHWSKTASKEQKEVIRYILWNMVFVEGGTMQMGENNDYLVSVPSFYMNRYEVNQDEWYTIMGKNPSNQHRRDCPVDQINWFDAQRFTKQLSLLSGLLFRLPFEAEWEYAARGGANTQKHVYAGSNVATEVAWFRDRNKDLRTYVSYRSGKKKANELGLYDMSGNMYEWCLDWYDKEKPFTGNIDPKYTREDSHKVIRGGSYYTIEKYCRVTNRYGVNPQRWDIDYGLRLVIELPNATEEGASKEQSNK